MKIVIVNEHNGNTYSRLNGIIDWLLHMVGYTLVLITVASIFKKTIQFEGNIILWGFIATIIIYVLNKTIKPILFYLTIPITGVTLGLFYPFLNVIILNIVDFILGNQFSINGIFMSFIVAILISIMNMLMECLVINPLLKRGD